MPRHLADECASWVSKKGALCSFGNQQWQRIGQGATPSHKDLIRVQSHPVTVWKLYVRIRTVMAKHSPNLPPTRPVSTPNTGLSWDTHLPHLSEAAFDRKRLVGPWSIEIVDRDRTTTDIGDFPNSPVFIWRLRYLDEITNSQAYTLQSESFRKSVSVPIT